MDDWQIVLSKNFRSMETTYQVIPQEKAIDQKKLHNKTKQEKQVNVRRTQP